MCDATPGGKFECTIEDEAYRFIARTSHACFISGELKDEVLTKMRKVFSLINTLIISSYFIPPYWMRKLSNWRVRQLRSYVDTYFKHVVQSYRDDATKCDSFLIRSSVDFESPEHDRLSDADVTDLILGFLYVSSENTSVGLANVVTLMAAPENKAMFDLLRKECDENLNDTAALLKGPILNACVMEMARLTTHIFSIPRMPMSRFSSLGPYHIGKEYDSVSLSGQMVMVHTADAQRTYHDALTFNPTRFLGKNKEPYNSPNIVTWGGGFHLCPGRMFALYEIKIALAHMVTNFSFEAVAKGSDYEFDYFSPNAFANRKVKMVLSKRENKTE
jgi:cytochrome P450